MVVVTPPHGTRPAADVLRDPGLASKAALTAIAYDQQANFPASWPLTLMQAGADAASGRFSEASSRLDESAALARRVGADDGLPDLLLVPAIAAHRRGDTSRGATWLRAIRDAGRPTQSFPVTIVYRQLRREWATVEPEYTQVDSAIAFDDARRWLADIGGYQPDPPPLDGA